ncbi:MAG: substrate-binding domain-containing protein [Oscillospiraceae bacterium]|nr:substrate-binding domain-containing protein [Oscillospiraceae bacterium]
MRKRESKKQEPKKPRNIWKIVALVFISLNLLGILGPAILFGGIGLLTRKQPTGQPDRLGSWGAISEEITRAKDWRQIVTGSSFHMGPYINPPVAELPTYPTINGSTVMVPMAMEFVWQHLRYDYAQEYCRFETTPFALDLLFSPATHSNILYPSINMPSLRPLDLYLGTAPSPAERDIAVNNGVELVERPVCWDAFVFITHKNNPVESLSLEQLRGIFSGEITNWSQVGGRDEAIRAYQREAGSGSQTGMEDMVMRGVPMADPIKVKIVFGMGSLVEEVAEYENGTASIGYTYRYYIDKLYKNNAIKMIGIEGVAPTDENIRSKSYPLSVNYYGIIRAGDEEKPGGRFLDWICSDEGQASVKQAGYIPMKDIDLGGYDIGYSSQFSMEYFPPTVLR